MRYAIVADIHSNGVALRSVFEDIRRREIKHVMCLGNIVGIGPEPVYCVDFIRKNCFYTMLGNLDYGIVNKAANCTESTARALGWARSQIESGDPEEAAKRWKFFEGLPEKYYKNGITFVHGSPRDPVSEYLFPEDVERNPAKIVDSFELFEKVLFVGHSHVPGIFQQNLTFTGSTALEDKFHYRRGTKVIINVGSVGQSRDGDNRACYIEINKNYMSWHRVEYDVDAVANQINEVEDLASIIAKRIKEAY
ncbi:MAG: metallophosphoesterase family protein [Planctomycetota bacterium]|nr:metallophosphoesterase family protein [Planctomycetota bacterium]